MDIYPEDLGAARKARFGEPPRQRTKRHQAQWGTAIALLAVVGLIIYLSTGAAWIVGILLLASPATIIAATLTEDRRANGRGKPLTPAQMQKVMEKARDPLEKEYLSVVLAAVSLPRVPEPAAETQVREAIRALGTAIEKMPASVVPKQSAQKLTGRAFSLAEEAEREPDPVVAATLRRRAETRQRQAQTMALIETLGRRSAAMRQEMSEQLDALQTSLAAFRMAGVWSVGEMAEVAAGIQWVALKAQTLAAAQVEMDDALHAEHLPNPHYNGPGGTRQRLQRYIAPDDEV